MKLKGFTLIELLVAIFVLAVGIMGVFQAFPFGTRIWKSAEMSTVATQLGQAKIEEITSKPYDEISVGIIEPKHVLDSPFNAYLRETKVTCIDIDSVNPLEVACDYDLTDPDPMKKIEVTVFWNPPFGITEKSNKLINLIAKR
ncbi:prepilin-type N-terminal cleavage/methylation domain-containing protein [Patescibacteria group bacterium]